jgi:hypothetical protein
MTVGPADKGSIDDGPHSHAPEDLFGDAGERDFVLGKLMQLEARESPEDIALGDSTLGGAAIGAAWLTSDLEEQAGLEDIAVGDSGSAGPHAWFTPEEHAGEDRDDDVQAGMQLGEGLDREDHGDSVGGDDSDGPLGADEELPAGRNPETEGDAPDMQLEASADLVPRAWALCVGPHADPISSWLASLPNAAPGEVFAALEERLPPASGWATTAVVAFTEAGFAAARYSARDGRTEIWATAADAAPEAVAEIDCEPDSQVASMHAFVHEGARWVACLGSFGTVVFRVP